MAPNGRDKDSFVAKASLFIATKKALKIRETKKQRSHDGLICEGVILILEGIEKHSSLQGASRELGMAYTRAWQRLKAVEETLGAPLVARKNEHVSGGTVLTKEGKKVLAFYRELQSDLEQITNERIKQLRL